MNDRERLIGYLKAIITALGAVVAVLLGVDNF